MRTAFAFVFILVLSAVSSLTALTAAEPVVSALPGIVYVPYDQADGVAIDANGVMLPYEQFVKLWDAAHPGTDPHKLPPPPVAAVLAEFTLTGHVAGDVATLRFEGTAIAVAAGWSSIQLPATLVFSQFTAADPRVVLERKADNLTLYLPEPGRYPITAELAIAVQKDAAGRRSLALTPPSAAAGRLDLQIDDGEVDVSLTPALAVQVTRAAGSTHVQAVIGASSDLAITWQPPARAIAGEALILSDSVTKVFVGERSLRYDLTFNVSILRRPVQELEFIVPDNAQVLAVDVANLQTWERVGNRLTLIMHQGAEGGRQVSIRLETLLEAQDIGSTRNIDIVWPELDGAARSLGTIAIHGEDGLAVTVVNHPQLAQTDPSQLNLGEGATAFRHLIHPPPSTIAVTRLESEIRASVVQFTHLSVDEDSINVQLDLDVRKAGIFTVSLKIPESWETVSTDGLAVDDIRPGPASDGYRQLDLALRSRLIQTGSLSVQFRAPPSIPHQAKITDLDIGVVELVGARHVRGSLGIAAPRSWALSASDRNLLTGADAEAMRRSSPVAQQLRTVGASDELALAFSWLSRNDEEPRLRLHAAPRARELVLRQEERVVLADAGIQRTVTWRGDVRFSPLPTLRIRAPLALKDRLLFSGEGLADQRIVADAEAEADGQVVWELRFQTPILGAFVCSAVIRDPLPELAPGKPSAVTLAVIQPEGATRLDTLVAIAREGTLDVAASSTGLERIPAADVPAHFQGAGLVTGFRGGKPAEIALEITRHDLVRLADGSVQLAHYAAALGDDGMLRVLGRLTVRSNGRPWLALQLAEGADLLEVAVDGRTARPSRRADGAIIIPLGEQKQATRIIGFVYEQRVLRGKPSAIGSVQIPLPQLASRGDAESAPLPVERVEYQLFLNEDLAITSWAGELSPTTASMSLWERLTNAVVPPEQGQQTVYGQVQRDGLTVPVLLDGAQYTLARLGDGGVITAHWCRRSWLDGAALLVAIISLVTVWLLRWKIIALSISCVVVIALVVGTAAPWQILAYALGAGAGCMLVILACIAVVQRIRRPRPVQKMDPWQVEPEGTVREPESKEGEPESTGPTP